MFTDQYIDKENNDFLREMILEYFNSHETVFTTEMPMDDTEVIFFPNLNNDISIVYTPIIFFSFGNIILCLM